MSAADEHRVIVEGLAAIATTLAEMGTSDEDGRTQLRAWVLSVGATSEVVREAVWRWRGCRSLCKRQRRRLSARDPYGRCLGCSRPRSSLRPHSEAGSGSRLADDLADEAHN